MYSQKKIKHLITSVPIPVDPITLNVTGRELTFDFDNAEVNHEVIDTMLRAMATQVTNINTRTTTN